jgi:hypothetical protein
MGDVMTEPGSAAALARLWIESWSIGDPSPIPLAKDFAHTSPFGRIEGRDAYLSFMEPMIGEGAPPLQVVRVLSHGYEAVIHYRIELPGGLLDACDWVKVARGQITEIHAFYDATRLRG